MRDSPSPSCAPPRANVADPIPLCRKSHNHGGVHNKPTVSLPLDMNRSVMAGKRVSADVAIHTENSNISHLDSTSSALVTVLTIQIGMKTNETPTPTRQNEMILIASLRSKKQKSAERNSYRRSSFSPMTAKKVSNTSASSGILWTKPWGNAMSAFESTTLQKSTFLLN